VTETGGSRTQDQRRKFIYSDSSMEYRWEKEPAHGPPKRRGVKRPYDRHTGSFDPFLRTSCASDADHFSVYYAPHCRRSDHLQLLVVPILAHRSNYGLFRSYSQTKDNLADLKHNLAHLTPHAFNSRLRYGKWDSQA
jgi:hypothetical protein